MQRDLILIPVGHLYLSLVKLGLTLWVELGGALTLLPQSDHPHHLRPEARASLLVVIVIVVSPQRTNLSSDARRLLERSRRRPAGGGRSNTPVNHLRWRGWGWGGVGGVTTVAMTPAGAPHWSSLTLQSPPPPPPPPPPRSSAAWLRPLLPPLLPVFPLTPPPTPLIGPPETPPGWLSE